MIPAFPPLCTARAAVGFVQHRIGQPLIRQPVAQQLLDSSRFVAWADCLAFFWHGADTVPALFRS